MHIYIPTMGRVDKQDTLVSLTGKGEIPFPVTLVCPRSEEPAHLKRGRNVISPPDDVQRIAATRQWIMEWADDDYVVMMDDDLTFAARRTDEPTKFRVMEHEDTVKMLDVLREMFSIFKHVSIAMREGANRDTDVIRSCCRVARVIGYHKPTFFAEGADFRNSTVMDDFEVTLHLLTRGHSNGVLNSYVQNQRGSGTEGGAALYRDLDMHRAAAELLSSRYPEYVKTVQKTTKTAWGGATRTDVIVQWKKARFGNAAKDL